MGRTPYLTRLALGRSAFERFVDPEFFFLGGHHGGSASGASDPQDYDETAKPRNPLSKANKEAQIRAMNEILEVVGVTERKSKQDQHEETPEVVFSAETWATVKAAEDDLGEDFYLLTEFIDAVVTWWIDVLRRRMQAGLVDCSVPFMRILHLEWLSFRSSSWTEKYHYVTAGLEMELLGTILAEFATDPLRYAITWLRMKVRKARLRPRQKRFCFQSIEFLKASGYLGIQLLFSPFTVTSILCQFRAVEDRLVPSYSRFFPWSSASPYHWGFAAGTSSSPLGSRLLNTIVSPLSLYLIYHTTTCLLHDLAYAVEHSSSSPAIITPMKSEIDMAAISRINPLITSFTKPFVTARDFLLYHLSWSHTSFIKSYRDPPASPPTTITTEDLLISLGAAPDEIPEATHRLIPLPPLQENHNRLADPSAQPLEHRSRSRPKKRPAPTFRTTRLSTLPADLLGDRIKTTVFKIVLIPLEILLHRSVLVAFSMAQSGATTSLELGGGNERDSGLAGRLLRSTKDEGQVGWGQILGKVGLCLLLEAGMEVVVWGVVWGGTEWVGRRWCAWGRT
ncbi:hypothetical protein KVT40_008324 [Elsinoe batatas]|uniref:Uncharacterized protein n=1 Tax=Elsinoe batatas TaxID=2601811 RepID=A0A8K0L018_9PEZI|nr:hypothetical protein KVT40_008324 [Elsinoe batatas]